MFTYTMSYLYTINGSQNVYNLWAMSKYTVIQPMTHEVHIPLYNPWAMIEYTAVQSMIYVMNILLYSP